MNTHEITLTGKHTIEPRFFGGYNIKVEVLAKEYDDRDGTFSPEFKYYRKATLSDLKTLNLL